MTGGQKILAAELFPAEYNMPVLNWRCQLMQIVMYTHTPVYWPFVQDYPGEPVPEGKTNVDFTEARDSEWQWQQLGYV